MSSSTSFVPRPAPSIVSRRCGRAAARGSVAQADAGWFPWRTAVGSPENAARESTMRLIVAAIGRLKAGPERELAERYRDRIAKGGRAGGLGATGGSGE